MLLSVGLLACTEGEVGNDFRPDAGGLSSGPRHPEASYTAEEAAYQMKEAVRFGLPSGADLWAVWSELLGHGDATCPGPGAAQDKFMEVFDPEGCEAKSGYWFQGVGGGGLGWMDTDGNGQEDTYIEQLKGDGSMRTPEGAVFEFGGDVEFRMSGDMEYGEVSAEILGSYSFEAASASWLAAGSSSALYMEGTREGGVWKLTLNGGATVAEQAVAFEDYGLNGVCGGLPSGRAAVRDSVGYWYELTYDETTCDGCGEVVFDHDQSLGRACADLSPAILYALTPTDLNMGAGEP